MDELIVARDGGVVRVTLRCPPLNLLTPSLIAALGDTFRDLARDEAARVVVLGAEGRAFSAGVDVRMLRDLDPVRARGFISSLQATIRAVRALDVPTLARLQGHVLGGALELVLGCDLRLAAQSCRLGMPEIKVGIPSVIEAALLPGLVGWGRATELLLTGEPIDAREAARWGLISRAVPEESLDAEVERWVARLLDLSPTALRLQKALLRRWRDVDLETAITSSMDVFATAYDTDEPRRAMHGFLAQRRSREEIRMSVPAGSAAAMDALSIGRAVTVRKTVGETDVYLFAGISGDFAPNHVDEEYMRGTRYGRRIAHGALLVGYMSQASTKMCAGLPGTIVSYGYDRVRFPNPVFIGDTVTVTYEIVERSIEDRKALSRVTCTNQRGDVVAVATHILKVVDG